MREKYIELFCAEDDCNDMFLASRYDAQFCSGKCRTRASRKRGNKPMFYMDAMWTQENRQELWFVRSVSEYAYDLIVWLAKESGSRAAHIALSIAIATHDQTPTSHVTDEEWEKRVEDESDAMELQSVSQQAEPQIAGGLRC